MFTKRRMFISFCIILFILSVHHDLNKDSISKQHMPIKNKSSVEQDFSIVRKKVLPGETVLSIIELINEGQLKKMNTYDLLNDFRQLNPKVDPFNIKQGAHYNFPKYD